MSALAFIGVDVVDMANGGTLRAQTVLTRDGRVEQVGPSAEISVPADAIKIACSGKTLIPGLADMHAHISPMGIEDGLDPDEALRRAQDFLLVFLVNGVTTIRNMAGTALHLRLRGDVANGEIFGPRIFSCGPILETRFTFAAMAPFSQLVTTPEEGRAAVRAHEKAGFDFIKVYNDIDADVYDAIIETAREVGIPVVGHVAYQKGLHGALKARQDSIEHLRSYDFAVDTRPADVARARFEGWLYATPQRIAELAEKTAEAGVWNAPTLVIERHIRTDEEMSDPRPPPPSPLPEWLRHELENDTMESIFSSAQRAALGAGRGARAAMVKALDDAGAGIMASSDCPACQLVPGRSLIRELELYVEAGLSPWRALRTATVNAAQFLREPQEGVIEPGRRADMVLLEGNPLEDITALYQQAGVVVAGRWMARDAIEKMLVGAA